MKREEYTIPDALLIVSILIRSRGIPIPNVIVASSTHPVYPSLHDFVRGLQQALTTILSQPDIIVYWPFPDEISILVMEKLDPVSLYNFLSTCRRFRDLFRSNEEYFARQILESRYPLFIRSPRVVEVMPLPPPRELCQKIRSGELSTGLIQLYEIELMAGTLMSCSVGRATLSNESFHFETMTSRFEEGVTPARLRLIPPQLTAYISRAAKIAHDIPLDDGLDDKKYRSFWDDLHAHEKGINPFSVNEWIELQWGQTELSHCFTWWAGIVREVTPDLIWIEFPQFPRANSWRWIAVPIKTPGPAPPRHRDGMGHGCCGGIRHITDPQQLKDWQERLPIAKERLHGD